MFSFGQLYSSKVYLLNVMCQIHVFTKNNQHPIFKQVKQSPQKLLQMQLFLGSTFSHETPNKIRSTRQS
jgi:hypothetical protein